MKLYGSLNRFFNKKSLAYINIVLSKDIKDIYSLFNKVFGRDPDLETLIKAIKDLEGGYGVEKIEKEFKALDNLKRKEDDLKVIKNKNYMLDLRNKITYGIEDNSWAKFKVPAILISTNTYCSRFKATSNHLKKLDINYELEIGILPNQIRDYIIESNGVLYGQINYNNVRLTASFVSHINALKNIYKKFESEIYFVMEDDIRLFPEPYLIGLENIFKNYEWDILQIESYYKDNEMNDDFLYSAGVICRRWERRIDIGAGGYFIKRKFIKKIIDYLFEETEKGLKINLEKTYLQTYGIAADSFLYMYGNTLKSTFPLAQQSLDSASEIGYPDEHTRKRLIAEVSTYNKWLQNYNYKIII